MMRIILFVCVLFSLGAGIIAAQVLPPAESIMPEEYDPSEFPLWTHDLRRFEIVTFGTFPVTYFLASLIYDLTIFGINNGDPSYALGTQRGENDIAIIIGSAAAASVVIGITDLIINVSLRNQQKRNEAVEQRMLHSSNP